ncbi:hypothetical protein B0H11DRAFT_2085466 [Mycena galericulata]|nr:hypothetical protein B0H11DRAFT_2085466 [Mycena galericulata]
MKASTLITFAAAAGLASAQLSLSSDCTNSLKGILASPEAACLNPSALLSFFVGTNQSVPNTVNNWLTGLCSQGFCSNATLASVVSNVTSGCASDLSGVGASVPATVTQLVQEIYPTVRNVMCLKDDASNQLCVTETLNNLEDIVGKLSFSSLDSGTLVSDFQTVVASASNLACTDCTKAAFTLISPLTQQFPEATTGIDALCGANFIDGSSPTSVSQTAVNEQFSTKSNSAVAVSTSKLAGAVMLLLLSAFSLLG